MCLCRLNLIFGVLKQLLQQRETKASFVFIMNYTCITKVTTHFSSKTKFVSAESISSSVSSDSCSCWILLLSFWTTNKEHWYIKYMTRHFTHTYMWWKGYRNKTSNKYSYYLSLNYHKRFTALFPGPPGWVSARRELMDFMVQGKINRGRHTDHPDGRHSIRTNQCPLPPSPIFYRPDALPATQPTVLKHWRQHTSVLITIVYPHFQTTTTNSVTKVLYHQ